MGTALTAAHGGEGSREPSLASVASPARRLASWLLLLCALVSILILWGGIVRLTGSGLSIPEWPLINGSLLPPFTEAGWQTVYQTYAVRYPDVAANLTLAPFQRMFAIEYLHRFLAALVGIVFLALFVRTRRHAALWSAVRSRFKTAAWLLVAQAVLGGIVVKLDLKAEAVALHLGMAFLFFGLLLWTALSLSRGDGTPLRTVRNRVAWFALGGVFLQIVTGGLVAGTAAGLLLNTWPKMGAYWIPPLHLMWADWYTPAIMNLFENQVLIQFIHRWLAFVAAGLIVVLVGRSMLSEVSTRGRIALRAVTTVLVLQLLLGIGNLLFKVPPWMAFAHLAAGLLLYTTVLALTYELTHPE